MAKVDVRVDDFEDGALPRICASSGAAADRAYEVRATYQPAWPVVFILLGPIGWLIMLVVAAGAERRVGGLLPFADAAHERMAAARRSAWIHLGEVVVSTAAVMALLFWLDQPGAVFVALLVGMVAAGSFGYSVARPRGSVAKLSRTGREVRLINVSDQFATAYRHQEQRRLARRQADPSALER